MSENEISAVSETPDALKTYQQLSRHPLGSKHVILYCKGITSFGPRLPDTHLLPHQLAFGPTADGQPCAAPAYHAESRELAGVVLGQTNWSQAEYFSKLCIYRPMAGGGLGTTVYNYSRGKYIQ